MRSKISKACLGVSLVALCGCSTVGNALNPYNSEFKCGKDVPFGQCADTPEIYSQVVPGYKREAKAPSAAPKAVVQTSPSVMKTYTIEGLPSVAAMPAATESVPVAGMTTAESAYREASLSKAAKLLKDPVTPVVIPPLVMRVWIAPRKSGDGVLDMGQYVFMIVDKPRFAMGDYLNHQPED